MSPLRLSDIAKRSWRLFRTVAASFSLVASLLLLALWADSYRKLTYIVVNTFVDHTATPERTDDLQMTHSYIASQCGTVMLGYGGLISAGPEVVNRERTSLWIRVGHEPPDGESAGELSILWLIFRDLFRFRTNATGWSLIVPHWFLLPFIAALTLTFKPKPRFRFSIADLVTFTTVAAVTLGGLAAFYRAYSA